MGISLDLGSQEGEEGTQIKDPLELRPHFELPQSFYTPLRFRVLEFFKLLIVTTHS